MSEAMVRRCDFRIKIKRGYEVCNQEVKDNKPTIFSFDDTFYSVDLCPECKLRAQDTPLAELIAISRPEYAKVAHQIIRMIRSRTGEVGTPQVRKWLRENGYDVPATGQISKELWAVFEEAHPEMQAQA